MDTDRSRQSPSCVHTIMATVAVKAFSCDYNTHGRSCHRRRWKTRMKMDGLIRGAEERRRLQRFPWHEQIDTTAPPPKCLVLSKIGRWCTKCWWDIMTLKKLWPPAAPWTLWSSAKTTLPAYDGDAFKTAPGRHIFCAIFTHGRNKATWRAGSCGTRKDRSAYMRLRQGWILHRIPVWVV